MLLFSFLFNLSCDVFNSNALPCVDGDTLRQAGNFRRVKCADEIVVDFKALRPALAHALGLIDNVQELTLAILNELVEKSCRCTF